MFYKILILTPPLKAKGGVSIYQKSLKGKLNNSIYYFVTGSRNDTASIFKTISRLTLDYCSFIKKWCFEKRKMIDKKSKTTFFVKAILYCGYKF